MSGDANISPPPTRVALAPARVQACRGRSDSQRVRPEVAGPMTSSAVREGGPELTNHRARGSEGK